MIKKKKEKVKFTLEYYDEIPYSITFPFYGEITAEEREKTCTLNPNKR